MKQALMNISNIVTIALFLLTATVTAATIDTGDHLYQLNDKYKLEGFTSGRVVFTNSSKIDHPFVTFHATPLSNVVIDEDILTSSDGFRKIRCENTTVFEDGEFVIIDDKKYILMTSISNFLDIINSDSLYECLYFLKPK